MQNWGIGFHTHVEFTLAMLMRQAILGANVWNSEMPWAHVLGLEQATTWLVNEAVWLETSDRLRCNCCGDSVPQKEFQRKRNSDTDNTKVSWRQYKQPRDSMETIWNYHRRT